MLNNKLKKSIFSYSLFLSFVFAEQAAQVALDSTNRWTDNIFSLQSWANKKFSGMENQLTGFFKQVSTSLFFFFDGKCFLYDIWMQRWMVFFVKTIIFNDNFSVSLIM